jgi:hypothetical protein
LRDFGVELGRDVGERLEDVADRERLMRSVGDGSDRRLEGKRVKERRGIDLRWSLSCTMQLLQKTPSTRTVTVR